MKKCPFKEGDHVYHIKSQIHYIVSKIYNICNTDNSDKRIYVYIVDERAKGPTLPLIFVREKEWKNYLTLKEYRKLKLQKLNEIRL